MKKDYQSPNPQYVIADKYEGWPQKLPTESGDSASAMTSVMEQFIAEDTKATVVRELDCEEICAYRDDYTSLMEKDKIECEARLSALAAEEASIKERIKTERDTMSSIMQRINDNIRTINKGTVEEELSRDRSIRIAVDGHYLYYTYVEGQSCFLLAKVQPILDSDSTMFTRQTKNQEVFISLFGVDFTPRKSFALVRVSDIIEKLSMGNIAAPRLAATMYDLDGLELGARDAIIDEAMLQSFIDAGIAGVVIYANRDDETGA